ncbi:MAG: hypothetical protein U0637_00040 [Phycisphaerales bacterium]
MGLVRVRGDAYHLYASALAARGARLGDIKPTCLSRLDHWSTVFGCA